jgi:hypothetical protein
MVDIASGLSLTPPQETTQKITTYKVNEPQLRASEYVGLPNTEQKSLIAFSCETMKKPNLTASCHPGIMGATYAGRTSTVKNKLRGCIYPCSSFWRLL